MNGKELDKQQVINKLRTAYKALEDVIYNSSVEFPSNGELIDIAQNLNGLLLALVVSKTKPDNVLKELKNSNHHVEPNSVIF